MASLVFLLSGYMITVLLAHYIITDSLKLNAFIVKSLLVTTVLYFLGFILGVGTYFWVSLSYYWASDYHSTVDCPNGWLWLD